MVNMNADIKNTIMWCATCMEYQWTQPQEKPIPYGSTIQALGGGWS